VRALIVIAAVALIAVPLFGKQIVDRAEAFLAARETTAEATRAMGAVRVASSMCDLLLPTGAEYSWPRRDGHCYVADIPARR
jgi:hypothetical protein